MCSMWVDALRFYVPMVKLYTVGVRRPSFVSFVVAITTNDDDGKLLLCVASYAYDDEALV